MVLAEAASVGNLVVHGDPAWQDLVRAVCSRATVSLRDDGTAAQCATHAHFDLRPPVDYYGPLAGVYASARVTLGATSPLLPHGLTQRHFDVWAAGGLLATDATPGMSLFPRDLAEPVTYRNTADIPGLIARLEADPVLRRDIMQSWRTLIKNEHTYGHRVATILERTKA